MKKQTTFKLEDTGSFLPLTKEYFLNSGFNIKSEHHDKILFSGGSIFWNMVTFNPLRWKSEVNVDIANDIVVADFDINIFGQMVTPKEEKMWDTFIENYKISLMTKRDLTADNKQQLSQTRKDSWHYVKWAIVGAITFGVPLGFLSLYTNVDMLTGYGAALGSIIFPMYKIYKERDKNSI